MTKKITNQYAEELLYNLLYKNHITNTDISCCVGLYRLEIERMENIFDCKNDREKILTSESISLLAQEQGNDVINHYSKKYNMTINTDLPRKDIVLILTSFMHNPVFYSNALVKCEDVKSRLEVKTEIPKTELRLVKRDSDNKDYLAEIVRNDPKLPAAAATASDKFKDFLLDDYIKYNDIGGKLYFKGNKQKQYLEFVFDIYHEKIPFYLEIIFITKNDKDKNPIVIPIENVISGEEGDRPAIRSETKNWLDYSSGIEKYTVRKKKVIN
jgi:hypothetical protein